MLQKNDVLHLIAKLMNLEQVEFSKLKHELLQSKVDRLNAGAQTIEFLTLIYESRRELLESIHKEIQGM